MSRSRKNRIPHISDLAGNWWAACPKCGTRRKTIYDRCGKCKAAIAELVLIAPKKGASEAAKRLAGKGIPFRLGPGGHPTVRVPPRSAEAARKLLTDLSTVRSNVDGYTLVVTGSETFAAEAGERLTRSGLRFECKPAPRSRVTIRVPIMQSGTGIDEVYPLEADLVSKDHASYWRCLSCGRGFDGAVNYCPGCRAFVGDAHAM
jgi:hypothetical protein